MKVSYSWLRRLYPSLALDPHAAAARLGAAGTEVESVQAQRDALDHVVVVEIIGLAPHPNADQLQLVTIHDGAAEQQLVSGAPNLAVGQRVPLARVGARLAGGLHIAPREIRGILSEGMLCSEAELGLSRDASGVLQLRADAPLGAALADVLGRTDVIFELAPAANRPDLLSHLGVARELAALVAHDGSRTSPVPRRKKKPARKRSAAKAGVVPPRAELTERGAQARTLARVRVEAAERCPLYTGRVLEGVRVAPSPIEVQQLLEAIGVRAISNVVDATNLVLFELGQPLHAFDLDKLRGPQIVVRQAAAGEVLKTLDGVARALVADDLVIADAEVPVALAGVMGGLDSEVGPETTRILLESAIFQRQGVRRTAKRHGLHTEASHRFERGVDAAQVEAALDRAAALIVAWGGGAVRRGILSAGKRPRPPAAVALRVERASMLLGREVTLAEARQTLRALGLMPVKGKALRFQVPTWRVDLEREVDLIDELGRVGGLDDIPVALPPAPRTPRTDPAVVSTLDRTRDLLVGEGYLEAITLAFASEAELEVLGLGGAGLVLLANPLGEETAVMRPSMLPALLRTARHNASLGRVDLRLFELGRTFRWAEHPPLRPSAHDPRSGELPIETRRLGLLWRGVRAPRSWARTAELADVYDLKGTVEALLDDLDVNGARFVAFEHPLLHPRASARVVVGEGEGEVEVGFLGALHPDLARKLDLDGAPVFLAELSIDAIEARRGGLRRMRPLPRFPRTSRDLSFFVRRDQPAVEIIEALRALPVPALEAVDLFDVYEGAGVPEGQRSLAVTLRFGLADRTLTDAEVEGWMKLALERLVDRFGAVLRVA